MLLIEITPAEAITPANAERLIATLQSRIRYLSDNELLSEIHHYDLRTARIALELCGLIAGVDTLPPWNLPPVDGFDSAPYSPGILAADKDAVLNKTYTLSGVSGGSALTEEGRILELASEIFHESAWRNEFEAKGETINKKKVMELSFDAAYVIPLQWQELFRQNFFIGSKPINIDELDERVKFCFGAVNAHVDKLGEYYSLLQGSNYKDVTTKEFGCLLTKSYYINDLFMTDELCNRIFEANNDLPTPSMDYRWWSGAYELDPVKAAKAAKSSLSTPPDDEPGIEWEFMPD